MNQEKRKEYNLKQLNIEISADDLARIKLAAERRNIPIRTWVLRALLAALQKEEL